MSNGLLFPCPTFWSLIGTVSVLSSCSTSSKHQQHQPAVTGKAWGHPRVLDAACVKTRSVLAQRPPTARSIHVTPRAPIGSRGWSVSILASSHLLSYFTLLLLPYPGTLPYLTALCPLLVSLGSAPGSRVARPRRNTATFASPPWLLVHGQWLMSFGLGGDKKLYAIAAMSDHKDNT